MKLSKKTKSAMVAALTAKLKAMDAQQGAPKEPAPHIPFGGSLAGGDGKYTAAQVRATSSGLRFQLATPKIEASENTPADARAYVQKLAHNLPSVMGTKTMYAFCQVRLVGEGLGTDGHWVRVQIPGPAANRPYGMVFCIRAPHLAAALKGGE